MRSEDEALNLASSHPVTRRESLSPARHNLSVSGRKEPGATRARCQVSGGELRCPVVTMMLRCLDRCYARQRERERRSTRQDPFVRH